MVIIGSSRKNGNTSLIVERLAERLGCEVFHLSDYSVSYYDTIYCATDFKCVGGGTTQPDETLLASIYRAERSSKITSSGYISTRNYTIFTPTLHYFSFAFEGEV